MFEIGIIVKPHGIAGELRVLPTTDDPTRFSLLKEVTVRAKNGATTPYKLTRARPQQGMVLVKLAEVNDRNMAETMAGGVLLIPDEVALPLDTDEYYIRDLVGLAVVTEDGQPLGTIRQVFATGANDVYIIEAADGEDFMLPAIKDVVQRVDMQARVMTVRLMEGLRELTV